MNHSTDVLNQFEIEVLEGLRSESKYLSSKYFYDARGDALFRDIMRLDEYYLTRKETEIFESQKERILAEIDGARPFRIIELGAGDGSKTRILLKYFLENGIDFTYTPVDISSNVLKILEKDLLKELPDLKYESYVGDYFDALSDISNEPEKDVVFFLGSTIGNFPESDAVSFLSHLRETIKTDDLLFMGVDLKKDPNVILRAYDDSKGVTTEFNMNLLDRINRELAGNFDRNNFMHYPYYNPHSGECRSYLISTEPHVVSVSGEEIRFRKWEAILMEVSKKYDMQEINLLAEKCGYKSQQAFYDNQQWFTDVLWKA